MSKLSQMATRIAAQQEGSDSDDMIGDGLSGSTEYSCNIDLNISATFEGSVSKAEFLKKLREELKNAIATGMSVVSSTFDLSSVEVKVRPIKLDLAMVDDSELEVEVDGEGSVGDVPADEGSDDEGSDDEGSDDEGSDEGPLEGGSSEDEDEDEDEDDGSELSGDSEGSDDTDIGDLFESETD